MNMRYVLLDDEGKPIRYFTYPATGTLKVGYEHLVSVCGECLV